MKTYCFKLYRAKRNKKLHRSINIAGSIYNHLIALHRRYYRLYGRYLHANRLKKHITKLKKLPKYAYWNKLGSQAIQDIAERIDRALSSRKKDSNNRKRAKLDLARGHKRIANQRKDFHFKLAKELAEKYATICIEDLNLKAMQREPSPLH